MNLDQADDVIVCFDGTAEIAATTELSAVKRARGSIFLTFGRISRMILNPTGSRAVCKHCRTRFNHHKKE
jgi:hypothetical protein